MERKLRFGDHPVLEAFFGIISQADDFDAAIRFAVELIGIHGSVGLVKTISHLLDGNYTEEDLSDYFQQEIIVAPVRLQVTARENLEEYREDILSAINEIF